MAVVKNVGDVQRGKGGKSVDGEKGGVPKGKSKERNERKSNPQAVVAGLVLAYLLFTHVPNFTV